MESWRTVWRNGFLPELTTEQVQGLRDAVRDDDPRLIQGSTTTPPPLMCVQDWPVECGCAIGYCGVLVCGGFCPPDQRDNPVVVKLHAKVGEVEEQFAQLCFKADQRLGEPAACRFWLNWFDDTPRDEMRREFLAELDLNLQERISNGAVSPADVGSTA